MAPRLNEKGEQLPRTLLDVKADGMLANRIIQQRGDEAQKAEGNQLVTQLSTIVDECLAHEETNEKITTENEDNSKENEQLAQAISEQEAKLNEQEQQIEDQLQSVEDELAAARAALSDPPTPEELALIEELENMKKGLLDSRQALQADRARLQETIIKSQTVYENCNSIRNDCNEVRQRIHDACNPYASFSPILGAGGNDEDGLGFANGADFVNSILEFLKTEIKYMTELRDYLNEKIPEIQAKHDTNTALLAEVKHDVKEVKENTAQRQEQLTSSQSRLDEIRSQRLARQKGLSSEEPGIPSNLSPPPDVIKNVVKSFMAPLPDSSPTNESSIKPK